MHELARNGWAVLAGGMAHNKPRVLVSQVGSLARTLYMQGLFEKNTAVISPTNREHLLAIWAFCRLPEFYTEVRRIDHKVAVTNITLVKVPFELERWQKVAEETGPLPKPYSNDLNQWLFEDWPVGSTAPLQVALACLLG